MTKPKNEGFVYGIPPVNAKFGCTKLLMYPMPLTWDFIRVRQFIKTQCESEELKASSIFLYKENKDSDRIWAQFDSESLCQLAYTKLQGIELNGKPVKVEMDKRLNRQNFNMNKPPNKTMQNNFNSNNNMGNYNPTPPTNDMGPSYQETYGLSVGFLTSLGIQPPLRNKVFVANLVPTVTERELQNVMSLAGRVTNVTLLRTNNVSRGQAAVEFDHAVEAVQAISMLNNQEFYGRPLVVRMYKHEPKLPLPTGLSSVGMGLGPNGEPMKAVGTTIEILPLKHRLEKAIKRLSGETVPDDNYVTPYGAAVVDNFNPNFGMPPFCMPNGPMPPFMPFPPDGSFMPGPMGIGPNMPMPGPNMPMPGPNMPMPGPNMGMPPNMMPGPMGMPGPNMPIPGPNMPIPGPNMPMPGPNMPIPGPNMAMGGPNMPMGGPNMPMGATNMPMAGPKKTVPSPLHKPADQQKTPVNTPKSKVVFESGPKYEDKDIPGVSEVTLPKGPPPLPKSPAPQKSNKITVNIKSEKKRVSDDSDDDNEISPPREKPRQKERREKYLRLKETREREARERREKYTYRLKETSEREARERETKERETREREARESERKEKEARERELREEESREEESREKESREKEAREKESREKKKSKRSSRSRNGRSESSSPEREPEKSKGGSNELTDNLLKLLQGDTKKKPNLDALQGFMEQVINLSKTMSALRDAVPAGEAPERSGARRPRRAPSAGSEEDDTRTDKQKDPEPSKLSRTISALREKEPILPAESPKRVHHSEWSPDSGDSPKYEAPKERAKKNKWTDLEHIEPPPGKPSKEYLPAKEITVRESEWSARVSPAPPSPAHPHRDRAPPAHNKRTYVATMPSEPEPGRGPKARKTEQLPLITASDMLTFTNLPPTVTVSALSSKMRQVGELKFAELTGAGRAVVRFQRVQDAQRCIKLFHRSKVDGQIIEVVPY